VNVITHYYAFIDFKQRLTLPFADCNRWLFLLNSRWLVIVVLRLPKPLSKSN